MTAQRYRVRHPIEAWQLTADNITQVAQWCNGFDVADLTWDYDIGAYWRPDRGRAFFVPPREPGLVFQSPRGDAFVPLGDYVIRGYGGVFFPCQTVDFVETYELAPVSTED